MKTLVEKFCETKEGLRLFERERTVLSLTETVLEIMEVESITQQELARRIGKTQSYVSKLLNGRSIIGLAEASDIFVALGYSLNISAAPIAAGKKSLRK